MHILVNYLNQKNSDPKNCKLFLTCCLKLCKILNNSKFCLKSQNWFGRNTYITHKFINPAHCSIIKENRLVDFISALLPTVLTFSVVSHIYLEKNLRNSKSFWLVSKHLTLLSVSYIKPEVSTHWHFYLLLQFQNSAYVFF